MPTILIHVMNEDPVMGEIDELPNPTDQLMMIKNPRHRDGKDLHYLEANVTTVIWPLTRVLFIEVMPSGDEEDIITFVRE
ncbi:hypothetical protein LARV_02384 [Longilinea arvoryzae]|uniref:Uncharacterized protein n=1 Tax=Longilinea arvoryzae TaxID=360412 RepID=A0A0S7BJ55_9CHLR|nr:hypothetical protein [Longilinea arvoryzae]GAP14611.1 hypothetical protein LARV_02384 [Longilinea arvoryzae]